MDGMGKFQVENVLIVTFLAKNVQDLLILNAKDVKLEIITLNIMEFVEIFVQTGCILKQLQVNLVKPAILLVKSVMEL